MLLYLLQYYFDINNFAKSFWSSFSRSIPFENSSFHNSSVIVGKDGLIVDLGDAKTMDEKYANEQFEQVIDATGISFSHFLIRLDKIVLPSFVDAHTHV